MKVLFIINDGFEEAETIGPVDILKRAGIEVVIASNKTKATGAHGITFDNLVLLDSVYSKTFDCLVLPGGPQWQQNQNDQLYLELAKYYADNKIIAAICASPTILGALGYLKGKTYTCFPPMNKDFGGNFTGSDAEIDGNLITGRSAGSSLEFGFKVLERLTNIDIAKKVANSMFY